MSPASSRDTKGRARGWFLRLAAIVIAVSPCLVLSVVHAQAPIARAAVQTPSAVAVLRFSNISGQLGDEWIGAGIADTVVTDLRRGGTVSVIGPQVMQQMAQSLGADLSEGGDRRAAELGRRIGATWVVTGSYQRVGDQVRITARVVDVASGTVSQAVKVDGTIDQLFALQDRVVAELGHDLRGVSASSGRSQRQPALQSAAPQQDAAAALERPDGAGRETGSGRGMDPGPRSAGAPPRGGRQSAPEGAGPGEPGVSGPLTLKGASGVGSGAAAPIGLPFAFDGPPPPVSPAVISRDASGRATVRAVLLTSPIRIDGQLDESVYASVPSISDFIQQEPVEGAPPTEKTDLWVFFDRDNVYIVGRCWDSHPEREVANEMRRDGQTHNDDNFAFLLDTYYDRRNGVIFEFTPAGGRQDSQVTNGAVNRDWNPVWEFGTRRFDAGWIVETRIPFKSLRYRSGVAQIWGLQVRRLIRWKNEVAFLTPVPAALGQGAYFRAPALAATLVGIEAPPGSKNLEIKPYAISDLTSDANATPRISNDLGGDAGLDVKYGITQNLTADVTFNTDFAQVEADEQQVNLTRFSLFFPEKREFFVENQGVFGFGAERAGASDTPVLFYSRRIGFDRGRAVPIVGGGRLTGRVGPFSIGALHIQSDEMEAPRLRATNFSVVRMKRDVLRRSSIGAILTRRSVGESGTGLNEAYGVDGAFILTDTLNINAYWAQTRTPGQSNDDTSYRGQFDFAGDRYGLQVEQLTVGADFNPEVGFVRRHDMNRSFGQFRFSPRPRTIKSVRKFSWIGSIEYIENGAGRVEDRIGTGSFGIDFQNSDRFALDYVRTYEFVPVSFRVAPGVVVPVGGYNYSSVRTGFTLGPHRRVAGTVSVEYGTFYSGHKTTVSINQGRLYFPPHLSIEPSYSLNRADLEGGSFATHLMGSRVTYTMTPLMFASALLQYNSASDSISANVRFRWEYRPGSELFVVFNEQRDTLARGFPALANRALIVKINRLLRF